MIDGAMKMPEPIIEPTMIVVAEKAPRRRSRVGAPGGDAEGDRASRGAMRAPRSARYFTTRRYGGSSRFLRVGPAKGRGVGAGATTGRTGEARPAPGGVLSAEPTRLFRVGHRRERRTFASLGLRRRLGLAVARFTGIASLAHDGHGRHGGHSCLREVFARRVGPAALRLLRDLGRHVIGPDHAAPVVADHGEHARPGDHAEEGGAVEAQRAAHPVVVEAQVGDGHRHVHAHLQHELGLLLEPVRGPRRLS